MFLSLLWGYKPQQKTAWKGDREAECAPLLRACALIAYRGFESHPFRLKLIVLGLCASIREETG